MMKRFLSLNCIFILFVLVNTNENRNINDSDEFKPMYIDDDDSFSTCHSYLEPFAIASAEFVKCTILNAKPISVCRQCLDEFENAENTYATIKSNCNDVLVHADRLEVVETMNANNEMIWKNANCENCYNHVNETYSLTEDAKKVFELVNETQECFLRYNVTICLLNKKDVCANNQVCEKCNGTYDKLKKTYKRWAEKLELACLCMDVVDAMNMTRKIWNDFECVRNNNSIFVLSTVIGFLCLTPIVFYLSNWLSSDENKSKIVPQKRLVATRSHAQLSSINF